MSGIPKKAASFDYMAMRQIQLSLSAEQLKGLEKLKRKTGVDRANLIRLAISKLLEQEGVLKAQP